MHQIINTYFIQNINANKVSMIIFTSTNDTLVYP